MSDVPTDSSSSPLIIVPSAVTNANTQPQRSNMNPKDNFIVTGGCGFIGGHFVEALRQFDDVGEIIVVDDLRTPGNHRVDGVTYIEKSIQKCYLDLVNNDIDHIIHLGNTPRVRRALEFPGEAIENNVTSTVAVCELGLATGAQVYFAQSSSIRYLEDTSSNAYTLSKVMADMTLDLYMDQYGLLVTKMFYYNVYGPREADYGPYSTVIRRFKQKIEMGEPLEIFGTGYKTRDFTHVDDVVQNMLTMLSEVGFVEEVHLGRGRPYSIQEIADAFDHHAVYKFDLPGEALDTLCEEPYGFYDNDVMEYITKWVQESKIVH
jgi:UDP-glucose 4-epimerase